MICKQLAVQRWVSNTNVEKKHCVQWDYKVVHQTEGEGEATVNTLETRTDRNLKVQQRQIQSTAPRSGKCHATGQGGGDWLESFAGRGSAAPANTELLAHPCREEG